MAEWLTADEACAYGRLSRSTLGRALRSGQLKGYKISQRRSWRLRKEDIDAYLMAAATPVPYVPKPAAAKQSSGAGR